MPRLQQLALAADGHIYRPERPRFVFKKEENGSLSLLGFDDGSLRSMDEAPSRVLEYARQAFGPGPYHWLADVWTDPT
jgi:hypothetical protein